ncbi:NAD(P)H-dependent flavin oxidoreductase [Ornithinicoccus halotolerans]|uniref:NAD(P)H-dependent flavin oxidoreductase n=1 Tax=Ornithinicoccus halotolerans TaxID=1748220 RepID=UPI0018862605|nr:nitronate monooxygenase [Ornithinicoccus halotolerans]
MARMRLDDLDLPVIGAPMAGGTTTPQLVAAVSAAGGLGMLAAGYQPPEALAADVLAVKELTTRPFGVNLFVLEQLDRTVLEPQVAAYRDSLAGEAERLGAPLPQPSWYGTDHLEDKLALLAAEPVAVVSFTFGCPEPAAVQRLQEAGSTVLVTATDAAEARAAAGCGADAIVLQGHEAGAHRGTHLVAATPNRYDHLALLQEVAPQTDLPLVAAGGVTTAGDTRRAQEAGAVAVQVGTALLLSPESGAGATYRAALRDDTLTETVVTRAFTGRPARALRNRFVAERDGTAPSAFPQVDQVTKPLRRAAAQAGDVGSTHLWAGIGWRAAQERPAAEIVADLAP